ncbi:hypothetical protein PACTADRAFT_30145, partial [Pachysolen tannophilus NRRL Y-2460]
KSDILGWCAYAWACEPFIVSCIGTYVPLLLEQIARDNGVKLLDHSITCNSKAEQPPDPKWKKCVLPMFNGTIYVDTSSFALYTFAISVFIQTIVVISITGASDKGHYKKQLLVGGAVIGGLLTMMFILIDEQMYYTSSLLSIVTNAFFGVVNVCGNSYLPILANGHPSLKSNNDDNGLLRGQISSKISGDGASAGYISALLVQLATMFVILKFKRKSSSSSNSSEESIWPIQVAICFVGFWWLIFQIPVLILLRSKRANEELVVKPITSQTINKHFQGNYLLAKLLSQSTYIIYGWSTLSKTIRQASGLKDIVIFLTSWFIISDSLTTINSTAILFAKTELSMSTLQLAVVGTLTMLSAIVGAYVIPNYIQPFLKLSLKKLLQIIIIWSSLIPLYGILGFFFQSFGLKHNFEIFILAVWYGVSLGGIAAVSRSLFSMLIPKGKESMYFALFQITDKGSSIIGPLVVALITDKTHNIRHCFWFLWIVLIISLPILEMLDLQRGKDEADFLQRI